MMSIIFRIILPFARSILSTLCLNICSSVPVSMVGETMNMPFLWKQGLYPQIRIPNGFIGTQICGGIGQDDPAGFHDIAAVGDL